MSSFEGNWAPPPPPRQSMEHNDKAGFWIRFVAHIVDSVYIWFVTLPISIVSLFTSGDVDNLLNTISIVLGVYILARKTGELGGSPWRAKMGVLIIDEQDGSFIGTQRAVFRIIMSYVSGLVLLLGYLWMLWDPKKQTWHDKIAKSVVVRR